MQYKRSNKESFILAIEFLKKSNFDDLSIENEYAITRGFEVIGGILKVWVDEKKLVQNEIITDAIRTRDRAFHLYSGLDFQLLKHALSDFDALIELTKHINE